MVKLRIYSYMYVYMYVRHFVQLPRYIRVCTCSRSACVELHFDFSVSKSWCVIHDWEDAYCEQSTRVVGLSLPPLASPNSPRLAWRRRHSRRLFEDEAAPESHELHAGAAQRVGAVVLRDALPRRVHAGGDQSQARAEWGQSPGLPQIKNCHTLNKFKNSFIDFF